MTTGSPSTKPEPRHPREDRVFRVAASPECLPAHSWTCAALTLMDMLRGSLTSQTSSRRLASPIREKLPGSCVASVR
jgi:hypothetical protein